MNHISIRLILLIFFVNVIGFASRPLSQSFDQEEGLDGHINQARQSLDSVYYQLVERGFFPLTYNNNLIINSQLHSNPQQEGTIILKLVEWLEKQNDREGLFLLKRLNKLFYLEFHRLIFSVKCDQADQKILLEACQELYQHKAIINGYLEKPFRTTISKLYLLIVIVNGGELSYENKKQTLAYVLDKIKKELNATNQRIEHDKVDSATIKKFVTLLEIIAVKEPLVQSSSLRTILITTSIIVVACVILYYKVILPRWDEIPSWDDIKAWLGKAGDAVGQKFIGPVGRCAAKGALEEFANPEHRDPLNAILEPTIQRLEQNIPRVAEEAAGRAARAASEGLRSELERLPAVARRVAAEARGGAATGAGYLGQLFLGRGKQ